MTTKHVLAQDKYNVILKATDPPWVPTDPAVYESDSPPELDTVAPAPRLDSLSPISSSTRLEPPTKRQRNEPTGDPLLSRSTKRQRGPNKVKTGAKRGPKPKGLTPKPAAESSDDDDDEFGLNFMSTEQRLALFAKLSQKI